MSFEMLQRELIALIMMRLFSSSLKNVYSTVVQSNINKKLTIAILSVYYIGILLIVSQLSYTRLEFDIFQQTDSLK